MSNLKELLHQERIEDGQGKCNVAKVAEAVRVCETTCFAKVVSLQWTCC